MSFTSQNFVLLGDAGYTGTYNDRLRKQLVELAASDGTINDLWHKFFDDQGIASGSFNDRMAKYLETAYGETYDGLTATLQRVVNSGQKVPWSPFNLFVNGEAGAWYDTSDPSTLFQDSAGTTRVTADGDPVGLMLDCRYGLKSGPDIFPNNHTLSGANPWVDNGDGSFTKSAGAAFGQIRLLTLEVGKRYEIQFRVLSVSNSVSVRQATGGGTNVGIYEASTPGVHKVLMEAIALDGTYQSAGWLDGSSAGTDAVVSDITVRELPGHHATQSTSAARPTYRTDGTLHWLEFDGVDDYLTTASIDFTASDKMSAFVALRKESDASARMALELSPITQTNNGAFFVIAPDTSSRWISTGYKGGGAAQRVDATDAAYTAPLLAVTTSQFDIGGPSAKLRIDGTDIGEDVTSTGAGNFGNHALYIGSRGGTSLFHLGNIYGVVVRGAASAVAERDRVESYLAKKSGVTL